jgi:hypothetical protein
MKRMISWNFFRKSEIAKTKTLENRFMSATGENKINARRILEEKVYEHDGFGR